MIKSLFDLVEEGGRANRPPGRRDRRNPTLEGGRPLDEYMLSRNTRRIWTEEPNRFRIDPLAPHGGTNHLEAVTLAVFVAAHLAMEEAGSEPFARIPVRTLLATTVPVTLIWQASGLSVARRHMALQARRID